MELARSNLAENKWLLEDTTKNKNIPAAIRRFKRVISEFETTDQTPEALLRLTECYLSLGTKNEALRSASVLKYNFPNSIWTKNIPVDLINELKTN